jgi:hypothetical protein
MACHLSVVFADGQRMDYELHDAEIARFGRDEAKNWLGQEFEAAGCVPSNPVGKLLLADRIIGLAKEQSKRDFDPPSPWMKEFLAATAAALNCPVVTIDLGNDTLGY